MTVYWNFSIYPAGRILEHFNDPCHVLSDDELDILRRFNIPKRREEWLASRLLIKQLVIRCHDAGLELSARSIAVRKMPNGVPYVDLDGSGRTGWLSLSHSHNGVLVGFSPERCERFGVDMEYIEERSPQLVADFFTVSESRRLDEHQGEEKKALANVFWSVKESYLKAIEKGLNLDTRRIEIKRIDGVRNDAEWRDVQINVDGRDVRDWRIFFKRAGDYILTICVPEKEETRLVRMEIDLEKPLLPSSTVQV